MGLGKAVHGHPEKFPALKEHVLSCVDKGVYDGSILNSYDDEEWDWIDSMIDHRRDYLFTYAGLRQVVDKYLVQDRSSGEHYETPQQMYMMIAATLFQKYPKETRLDYVRRYYNAIQPTKINIPTPVMAGVRTPLRQFAGVFLLMLMTPSIVSLAVTWPLVTTLLNAQESVSTQVASGASTLRSEAERFNTQVLSPSSKV